MERSRRDFLRTCACAFGTAAFSSSVRNFGLINALAQDKATSKPELAPSYKALVCIFLFGGNDSNNMVIPYDGYSQYLAIRPASGSDSINIPQSSLLQITAASQGNQVFGLHPAMPELQQLYIGNKLAIVCNMGPLFAPMTRAQYLNGSVLKPENLFSHEDQSLQFQTSVSRGTLVNPPIGWGGRLADQTITLNGNAVFPMNTSFAGQNTWGTGIGARTITPSSGLSGFTSPIANDPRYQAMRNIMTLDNDKTLINSVADGMGFAIDNTSSLNTVLNNTGSVTTVFPNTGIGNQLKQVARTIAGRAILGAPEAELRRQLFFCSMGGYDTHTGQLPTHQTLLTQLSQAMNAFYNATVELGVASQVTTFTMSDFSRTMAPNLDGTDHAWGAHQFVLGGAVSGGNFYGTYPIMQVGTGDDSGSEGRWIPTIAVDQFGSTLALWFGLDPAQLAAVFPNISRFTTTNLGFMM
jgi:uncharacterized protein (DUF1501 family)